MHIIAGKYKYQKITLVKNLPFKPIITSIRESIFSVLNNHLNWNTTTVCDLFANSGVLGLEALSWNSQFCFFNDINQKCCQIIQKNCSDLKIKNAEVSCLLHTQFLFKLKTNKCFLDLIFLDPPFQKVNLLFESLDLLLQAKLLNSKAILVVHTNQAINLTKYSHLLTLTVKNYGQHYLYFLQFVVDLPTTQLNLGNQKAVIISGPSGVGKKNITQTLLAQKDLNLVFSLSVTTRLPRVSEQNGMDYHFVSLSDFQKAIATNDFIEHVEYLGNFYGTSKTHVQNLINQKKNVLFETEVEGAINIKKYFKKVFWIFLFPPSVLELRKRIEKRATESFAEIDQRLVKAQKEMQDAKDSDLVDYYVINNSQQTTITKIIKVLQKEWQKR